MQEVILYGITKEPVHCFHGDRIEISECVGGYGRDIHKSILRNNGERVEYMGG